MMMPVAAGGDPEAVLEDEFPSWEPWRGEPTTVASCSNRSGKPTTDLFQIDIVTREVRQLTYGTKRDQGISVSLRRSAWSTHPSGTTTFLFVVDVETRERTQLTSHALGNRGARFSPDGRTVAYSSNRTGDFEIWLHHLDGGPETRFTDDEGNDRKPEWSPNGRKILFASDREGGTYKLFVANAAGGTEPRLLTDQAVDFSFGYSLSYNPLGRWSPDDELIAYRVVEGPKGTELWTVGPDGVGARKRLDGVTGFDWLPEQPAGVDYATPRHRIGAGRRRSRQRPGADPVRWAAPDVRCRSRRQFRCVLLRTGAPYDGADRAAARGTVGSERAAPGRGRSGIRRSNGGDLARSQRRLVARF